MKRHYRIPLLLCSLCTASLTAVAQNTTNLPKMCIRDSGRDTPFIQAHSTETLLLK